MSVGRRICLGAEQELRGDWFVVIVSACQVISTAKGLAEGARMASEIRFADQCALGHTATSTKARQTCTSQKELAR